VCQCPQGVAPFRSRLKQVCPFAVKPAHTAPALHKPAIATKLAKISRSNALAFAIVDFHMVIMPADLQGPDMQFDRYIFKQMLRTSFAVTLTLVGIMWLFQTIRILELVFNRGAPMTDFLLMSVTVIPLWLTIAIPISVFVAVMWVFHRALVDRELLVAQASGRSAIQLARAPIALGVIVTTFLLINSVFLLPLSFAVYKEVQFKLRNTIPTVMLQDNVFIDVVDGMTMLIVKKYKDGHAENVFIHDEKIDGVIVTMTAKAGRFIEKDNKPAVILNDGQRFELEQDKQAGATLIFDTHTVSITPRDRKQSTRMPIEMNEDRISNLLNPDASPQPVYVNQRVAEGHYRIASPFLAFGLVIVASAGVLHGQIRRSTWLRRTFVTIALGIICISAIVSARSLATTTPLLIPLIYLSMLFPVVSLLTLLGLQSIAQPAARLAVPAGVTR
jgi:lipopolysaccharide export system permease protein